MPIPGVLPVSVSQNLSSDYLTYVIGAVVFDLNRLPQAHFTTSQNDQSEWIQTAFQGLCLESLLQCSLQLKGLRYVIAHTSNYMIVVLQQPHRYVGLLLRSHTPHTLLGQILQWAESTDLA